MSIRRRLREDRSVWVTSRVVASGATGGVAATIKKRRVRRCSPQPAPRSMRRQLGSSDISGVRWWRVVPSWACRRRAGRVEHQPIRGGLSILLASRTVRIEALVRARGPKPRSDPKSRQLPDPERVIARPDFAHPRHSFQRRHREVVATPARLPTRSGRCPLKRRGE